MTNGNNSKSGVKAIPAGLFKTSPKPTHEGNSPQRSLENRPHNKQEPANSKGVAATTPRITVPPSKSYANDEDIYGEGVDEVTLSSNLPLTPDSNSDVSVAKLSSAISAIKADVASPKEEKKFNFSSKKMEDILLNLGVKQSHVNIAIQRAKRTGENLSVIMRDFGFLTSEQVAIAVAAQTGYEYFSNEKGAELTKEDLPPITISDFENIVPVGTFDNNGIIIAVSDANDVDRAGNTFSVNGNKGKFKIKVVIASEHTIQYVYRTFYSNTDIEFDSLVSKFEQALTATSVVRAGDDADNLGTVQAIYLLLLRHACYTGASDLYLYKSDHVGIIRLKINGVGQIFRTISSTLFDRLMNRLVQDNAKADDLRIKPKESVIELSKDDKKKIPDIASRFNFRLELTESRGVRNAVIRILDRNSAATNLENLGFEEETSKKLSMVSRKATGFFLVTGPTGSGKTTSLYAILKSIDPVERSIQSIEDPIEYRHGLWQQYEIRKDATDKRLEYDEWLKALLRNAPDVILVGEVRDKEVADVCLNAANTGHLVFATLHTNNAALAVGRLKSLGVDLDLLGSVLLGVLAQRLIRTLCIHCKVPDDSIDVMDAFNSYNYIERDIETPTPFKQGPGCPHCKFEGYFGRRAVYEILDANEHVRRALEAGKPTSEIAAAGMDMTKSMWATGLKMVATGVTSLHELERMVNRD